MKKSELKRYLQKEVDVQALKSYDYFMSLDGIDTYENKSGDDWYQVTVTVLEKTNEYVHISVAVDDGGWRAFFPLSDDFLIFKDGRVDK